MSETMERKHSNPPPPTDRGPTPEETLDEVAALLARGCRRTLADMPVAVRANAELPVRDDTAPPARNDTERVARNNEEDPVRQARNGLSTTPRNGPSATMRPTPISSPFADD